MKSMLRTFALATLAITACLSQTMHAQTQIRAQVTVPFSFDYGTTHFGQGTYIITTVDQNVLLVRNSASNQSGMALTQTQWDPIAAKASLVTFRKYGDRYFLDEVSIAGRGSHVTVYERKAEKQAARELAMRGEEGTQVALALLPEHPLGN
jgi:hypothetical protein